MWGGDRLWLLAVPLALAALFYACRGAPLGTAVADDYSFLDRLTFQKSLDPFDSMGATFYWRPLSRQVYFSLVGPWLLDAPWGAALIHALFLGVIGVLVYRIARRDLAPPIAASIAAGVLLSEPTRVLLGWPSGAQHLMAAMFALLAIHEVQARRIVTAAIAALLGLLSHESAALALPLLPLITWRERREMRPTIVAAGVAGVAAAIWGIGYAVARHHHVAMPPPHAPGTAAPIARLPALFARALPAALNIEDVHGSERTSVLVCLGLAVIVAAVMFARPTARARLRAIVPPALTAAVWYVAGVLPLALLLPDWNEWRAWTPSLGFSFAVPALLGAASPWLALAWVTLRLVALLAAPGAPALVTRESPTNGSHVSFSQLVRLQHVVSSSRQALTTGVPSLAPHSQVCFWEMPRLAEFAYQGSRALQVWYRDSTISWGAFGGQHGLTKKLAAGIEFRFAEPVLAASVSGRAIELYQRAAALSVTNREDESDTLLLASARELGRDRGPFLGTLIENMALNAYRRGQYARADSLNEASLAAGTESASYWLLRSAIALLRNDRALAEAAILRSLEFDPSNEAAREIARQLGVK